MLRLRLTLTTLTILLVARAAMAAPQPTPCDAAALRRPADTARSNIIAAVDGAGALEAWSHILGKGGAVAWTVTEYNVDPRSVFVFAFDHAALRVYRAGAFGASIDRAMTGCLDPAIEAEAVIPWPNVREIEAGYWVLSFRLREAVEIRSDRGAREQVKELKASFHGAGGGELTIAT